ncbi:MAG: RES family NAD+ phosphorylase [Deltaproteobacteria bacterium]|nr:RES family NAD+ phosphorylase [Deltaproteobacteria bacterium]
MILFRIAKTEFIRDLSGTGPRLYGGRWNPRGMSVIYTSESRALAALELFVHLSRTVASPGFSLASIMIPDTASMKKITPEELSRNWRSYPAPVKLASLGASWIRSGDTLLLRVPSVIIPPEGNFLINPAHPEMTNVRISQVEPYSPDPRLMA